MLPTNATFQYMRAPHAFDLRTALPYLYMRAVALLFIYAHTGASFYICAHRRFFLYMRAVARNALHGPAGESPSIIIRARKGRREVPPCP
jgi:hypothetical protein